MAEPLPEDDGALHPRFRALEELPRALRPREKLVARGVRALAHRDLLALLLGSGLSTDPPLRIAARLAAAFELGRRAFTA